MAVFRSHPVMGHEAASKKRLKKSVLPGDRVVGERRHCRVKKLARGNMTSLSLVLPPFDILSFHSFHEMAATGQISIQAGRSSHGSLESACSP